MVIGKAHAALLNQGNNQRRLHRRNRQPLLLFDVIATQQLQTGRKGLPKNTPLDPTLLAIVTANTIGIDPPPSAHQSC